MDQSLARVNHPSRNITGPASSETGKMIAGQNDDVHRLAIILPGNHSAFIESARMTERA
jgi:hypothetical protein